MNELTNEPSLIISLSTVPERLHNTDERGFISVIKSLCEQKDDDYEIHINIPHLYIPTKTEYVIPDWLNTFTEKYNHLKVFRPEDIGPVTKVIPTIERINNPNTIILVVDDDLIYHEEMISEHRKYHNILEDSVICYDGRGTNIPKFNDIRDSWVICVTTITDTHFFQHYKSASYKRKYFEQDFFDDYCGKTMSDDVLLSKYFRQKGIMMYVVPYEKDNHLFETRELWDINQGVTTFPIISYAASVEHTGAKHPEMIKIQPPFYDPGDWGINSITPQENVFNFLTDKISHGYMTIYHKLFNENKHFKKIIEIGVLDGESLKLLSHYFQDAIIFGVHINDCSRLDSDKIKTIISNQDNKESLISLVENFNNDVDLIIDDGGHTMKQQQLSFGTLFKILNSGGYYILEDLHTSKCENRGYRSNEDLITSLDMLESFNKTGKITSNYMTEDEIKYLEENIVSIEIWSRTPSFSESVTSIIKKK